MSKDQKNQELSKLTIATTMLTLLKDCIDDELLFFEDEVGQRQIFSVTFRQAEEGRIGAFVLSEEVGGCAY